MTDRLPTYSVDVSREDGLWVAVVEGLPAGATDVEKFAELPDAVRDLIASLRDIEPDSFWIDWRYRLGSRDLTALIENLREWDHLVEHAVRQRDATRSATIESMRSAGLSYREIADVIGVSHQRVGQLVAESGNDALLRQPDELYAAVEAKLTRRLRGPADRDPVGSEVPSPFESVLVALLASAQRARPDFRGELLSGTASVLTEVATDDAFLYSR